MLLSVITMKRPLQSGGNTERACAETGAQARGCTENNRNWHA